MTDHAHTNNIVSSFRVACVLIDDKRLRKGRRGEEGRKGGEGRGGEGGGERREVMEGRSKSIGRMQKSRFENYIQSYQILFILVPRRYVQPGTADCRGNCDTWQASSDSLRIISALRGGRKTRRRESAEEEFFRFGVLKSWDLYR